MTNNSVFLKGNLARDPEIKVTQGGKTFARFTVVTNDKYLSNGEQKENTSYVPIVAWGETAEAVGNELKKGSSVMVEGRYTSRSYEGNDGQKKYITEVTANVVASVLGGKHQQKQTDNFSQFGTSKPDPGIPF